MKFFCAIALFALSLLAVGCGANQNNGSINGNWTASLMNSTSNQAPVLAFTLTLAQSNGSGVSVTNLNFTTASPCFASGSTATGGFTLSGNTNGVTSGGFQMNVVSAGSASGNLLTLQGTVSGNTISGTWTLSGTTAGCSGSGNFTMNRM